MIPNHLNEVSFGGSSGTYACMYSIKYIIQHTQVVLTPVFVVKRYCIYVHMHIAYTNPEQLCTACSICNPAIKEGNAIKQCGMVGYMYYKPNPRQCKRH